VGRMVAAARTAGGAGRAIMAEVLQTSRFRPAGFRKGRTAWRRASRPDTGRPARWRSTAFRDGWTAWRRRASRNPAAPRNAVSPWEAGAPRSAPSRWEAAANPWLGAIARCSRTGSSNPSPSRRESIANLVPRPSEAHGDYFDWFRAARGPPCWRSLAISDRLYETLARRRLEIGF
jgi:hypothetical protein